MYLDISQEREQVWRALSRNLQRGNEKCKSIIDERRLPAEKFQFIPSAALVLRLVKFEHFSAETFFIKRRYTARMDSEGNFQRKKTVVVTYILPGKSVLARGRYTTSGNENSYINQDF